jgi:hypothetical protein
MSLIRSLTSFLRPDSSVNDLEGGPGSIEMSPLKDFDQGQSRISIYRGREWVLIAELVENISQVQVTIAPHVERYQNSQRAHTLADAISIYAAQTSVALTELLNIVESHQHTKSINPELDDETFSKAGKAIDTIRHTNYKLHRRTQHIHKSSLVDMGLESAYQKGQSWLLSASKGTDYADALLWQFTNQHTDREGPGVSGVGGSRSIWPPTARTMRQTREYLNPPGKWFKKREVEFEDCTHTLEELKEEHREWAVKRLNQGGIDEWERDLIGRAVERSGGTVPTMTTDGDNSVAEAEGLYALGSDDGEEEGDVGLGLSRSTGPGEAYMKPRPRVSEVDQAWHAER